MKFKLENPPHQSAAIQSVVEVFRGMERNTYDIVYLASDGTKEAYICVDNTLANSTVDYFMEHPDTKFICIERALDSTKKFNLKNRMQDKFFAF